MMVSRSRTIASVCGDLTVGGAELEEVQSVRILRVTLDSNFNFEAHLRLVVSKAARSLRSCVEQESYLITHVCSNAVSMYMFCPAWSIVHSCGCRRRSLIWVCWIVLFAVRKGCESVSFVVWGTEERVLPCGCSMAFIVEWTTL